MPHYASAQDLEKIFVFTQDLLKMCLKWVEIFPQYIKSYQYNQQYPNIFIVDLDCAIASCGYEIFTMIHKCFGLCMRSNKFLKSLKQGFSYQGDFVDLEKVGSNSLMLSMVNCFGDLGGFKILHDFIHVKDKDSFKCPIFHTVLAVQTIGKLKELGVKPEFIAKTYSEFAASIEKRFEPEFLTDTEIKEAVLDHLKILI